MTSLRLAAALLVGLSLAACDEQEQGRAEPGAGVGGKADDAQGAELDPEIQREHLEAVGACEGAARRDREHTSVLRYVERTEIEQDRIQCISAANDGVRSALAATLQITAPELADDVGDAFDAWRSEHTKFCDTLLDAHEHATEKSISAVEAGCVAEAELRLAEAVEVFADLGGGRAAPPHAEARHDVCYELYTLALEEGGVGPDASSEIPEAAADAQLQARIDAEELLADCVEEELLEAIPELSARVLQSYPGRTQGQVERTFGDAFEKGSAGVSQVCIVLGYASAEGGPLAAQQCRVAAAMWQHELIGYVVPELAPDESAQPEDEGAPSDGE